MNCVRLLTGFFVTSVVLCSAAMSASAAPLQPKEFTFNLKFIAAGPATAPDGSVWLVQRNPKRAIAARFRPGNAFPVAVARLPASSGCETENVNEAAVAPNGDYVFHCFDATLINRVSPDGTLTTTNLRSSELGAMRFGKDGDLWVSWGKWDIARLRADGSVSYYRVTDAGCPGFDLAVATDGKVWFREIERYEMGVIDPDKSVSEAVTPVGADGINTQGGLKTGVSLVADNSNHVWVSSRVGPTATDLLRFDPDGSHTKFRIATRHGNDGVFLVSPDQTVWYFAAPVDLNSTEPPWGSSSGTASSKSGGSSSYGGEVFKIVPGAAPERLSLGIAPTLQSPTMAPDGSVWGIQNAECTSSTIGYVKFGKFGYSPSILTNISGFNAAATSSERGRSQARGAVGCSMSTRYAYGEITRAKIAGGHVRPGGRVAFELKTRYGSSSPSLVQISTEWKSRNGKVTTKALNAWTNRRINTLAPKKKGEYTLRVKLLGKTYGRKKVRVR